MLRRHVIGLGSLLLGALSFGGWSFSRLEIGRAHV